MYPLNAAHLFAVAAGIFVEPHSTVSSGILASKLPPTALNLSISPLTTRSFLFNAPFLLFKLSRLSLSLRSSTSGSASARPPRFASLLAAAGRRRFFEIFEVEEAMRERNVEDLMVRLSFFVERKVSVLAVFARASLGGRRGWIWPVMRWWRRVRAEGFEGGAVGACGFYC